MLTPVRRYPFAAIKARVFLASPRLMNARGPEIGLCAFGQDIRSMPPRTPRGSRLERRRRAFAVLAGLRAGIEAALPLPNLGRVWGFRRLLLCCRRDVVKVDVPAIAAVRIAPAGEDGHRRI